VSVIKLWSRILLAVLLVFIRILKDFFRVHNTDFEQCFEVMFVYSVLCRPKSSQRTLTFTASMSSIIVLDI
jgi:hypothetical protein